VGRRTQIVTAADSYSATTNEKHILPFISEDLDTADVARAVVEYFTDTGEWAPAPTEPWSSS
jgi:hypothetical protein